MLTTRRIPLRIIIGPQKSTLVQLKGRSVSTVSLGNGDIKEVKSA